MRSPVFAILAAATVAQAQIPTLLQLLQLQPDLSTLTSALLSQKALLCELGQLTNITVLAPTNAAFQKLLSTKTAESQALQAQDPEAVSALLAYHVVNGTYGSSSFSKVPIFASTILDQSYSVSENAVSKVTGGQNVGLVLDGDKANILSGGLKYSTVTEADITAVAGVTVHKIDTVLTLPQSLSDSLVGLNAQVGTSAIFGALETASLRDTLDEVQDLTIFVPSDRAFAAAASTLQHASVETLRSVLQYHAVTGSVLFSSDVRNTTIRSAAGRNLTLSVIDGNIFVNEAKIILANVLIRNGVVHVIDAVLDPDSPAVNRDTLDANAAPSSAFSSTRTSGAVSSLTQPLLPGSSTNIVSRITSSTQVVSGVQVSGSQTFTTVSTSNSAIQTFTGRGGKAISIRFLETVFGLFALLII